MEMEVAKLFPTLQSTKTDTLFNTIQQDETIKTTINTQIIYIPLKSPSVLNHSQ